MLHAQHLLEWGRGRERGKIWCSRYRQQPGRTYTHSVVRCVVCLPRPHPASLPPPSPSPPPPPPPPPPLPLSFPARACVCVCACTASLCTETGSVLMVGSRVATGLRDDTHTPLPLKITDKTVRQPTPLPLPLPLGRCLRCLCLSPQAALTPS